MNSHLPAVYEHRPAGAINTRDMDMGEMHSLSPSMKSLVRLKLIKRAPAIRRGAAGMAAPAEDDRPTAGTRIRSMRLFLVIGLLLFGSAAGSSAAFLRLMMISFMMMLLLTV